MILTSRRPAKPRRAPKVTETQEHKLIAAYFRKIGLDDNAIAFHIKNDQATAWQRVQAWNMGVMPGIPDWCVLHNGRAGFIELKPRGFREKTIATGKLDAHVLRQLDTHKAIRRAGCWVEFCETLEEVIETLRIQGVPIREESRTSEAIRNGLIAAMSEVTTNE